MIRATSRHKNNRPLKLRHLLEVSIGKWSAASKVYVEDFLISYKSITDVYMS